MVSEVARRHGLTPQRLFGWRRQIRQAVESAELETPVFVPAVIEGMTSEPPRKRVKPRSRRRGEALGVIEVEIEGVTVGVGRGAEAKTVAALLRALKAGA